MRSLQSRDLRTVDVARRAGCSVQQVRDLERDGVLPPVPRTAAGYRSYRAIHVHSALAYRALAVGVGPAEARRIVRAVHEAPLATPLALLDAAHARLHAERADLRQARRAAETIADEPMDDVRPSDAMTVSELAVALGVRPSTLRHWDAEGLVVPERDGSRGARRYTPAQVRDARIVHQLRKAGYRIEPLRTLVPRLRHARGAEETVTALAARDAELTRRSKALLDGAAELSRVLALVPAVPDGGKEARPMP